MKKLKAIVDPTQDICNFIGTILDKPIEKDGILTFPIKEYFSGNIGTVTCPKDKFYFVNDAKIEYGIGCAIYGTLITYGQPWAIRGITGRARRHEDDTDDEYSNRMIQANIEEFETKKG